MLAYKLAFSIRPIATVAVAGSWLTCFFLSLIDQSLLSGTPRAFAVPLFLWFLTSVSKQSNFQIALSCAMQALFYPPISVISAGVLLLSIIRWLPKKKGIGLNKKKVLQFVLGNAAISICLLPFILSTNEYGPIVSATEARLLPAFQAGGRSEFFLGGFLETYICGARAGFLPVEWGCGEAFRRNLSFAPYLSVLLLICTFSIPTLLCYRTNGKVLPKRSSLYLSRRALFLVVFISSSFWFIAAHIMLFDLHLPSRYSQHALRATMWIALALLVVPAIISYCRQRSSRFSGILAMLLALIFFILPIPLSVSPYANYISGQHPKLYQFIKELPKETLIASLSLEADNIPSFSARRVVTAREYLIPYSKGYIQNLRAKTKELIRAQYASSPKPLIDFINRNHPTHLLVDLNSATTQILDQEWWLKDFPDEAKLATKITRSQSPFLFTLLEKCGTFTSGSLVLASANCLKLLSVKKINHK